MTNPERQQTWRKLLEQGILTEAEYIALGGDLVAGDKIGRDQYKADNIHIYHPPAPEPQATGKQTYLKELTQQCNVLPLAAMGGEEGTSQEVGLDRVYTRLDTTTRVQLTEAEKEALEKQGGYAPDERPLTAAEAIAQNRCVVILGGPGSGKSSLVRQLAADSATRAQADNAPLPLFLTLRDLTPRLRDIPLGEDFVTRDQREQLRRAVFDQWWADVVRWHGGSFAEQLPTLAAEGRLLLIFDGLDEVPHASRRAVREAILSVAQPHMAQVIVTCRTRSYVGEAQLADFATFTLAPFDEEKIRQFAAGWYVAQRHLGRLDEEQAVAKTADLQRAATGDRMMPLAEIPLLLTTMAIIHQRDKELPKQRVLLYERVVELLVRRWQREKGAESHPLSEGLYQLLYDESNKIMPLLQQLAYALHQQQAGQEEARLGRYHIFAHMERQGYAPALIDEFLDYIDHRAGVLAGYGGGAGKLSEYDFLHRTFQEYLVGCSLVSSGRSATRKYREVVAQGDFWYVAAQLGAESLIYTSNPRHEDLADVAYALCPEREPESATAWRSLVWSGYVAGLLGDWVDGEDPKEWAAYRARLRRRLVALIEDTACPLNLFERAEAGRVLGQLGNARTGVGVVDGLPDLAWGGVVPAGKYTVGDKEDDDNPVREIAIANDYQLAKYPITNAQFACFVEAEDFGAPRWWAGMPEEDGWGKVQEIYSAKWAYPNHPRETVSWYQAVAFARWLSDKLGYEVRLPHEHEWEVAARYNDGRIYPWGDEFDSTKANTEEGSVGQTTAVGLYPTGRQPHLDLYDLSGNVWEWCQNQYKDLTQDGVDDSDNFRVLRGGSWVNNDYYARAAFRYLTHPSNRGDFVGFRVVRCVSSPISLAPCSLGRQASGSEQALPPA